MKNISNLKTSPHRLIIVAHCDDAILSLGGTILAKKGFTVLTIFSTCAWSVNSKLKNPKIITLINNKEEKLALKEANCMLEFGNEKEALLRGYLTWNTPLDYKKDAKLKEKIKNKIISKIQKYDEFYFPLAIGSHIDHRLIFKVFLEIKNEGFFRDKKIFLFEDLPYAIFSDLERKLEEIKRNNIIVKSLLIDVSREIENKCALLSIYKSQLEKRDIMNVKKYAQRIKGNKTFYERLWKVIN